MEKNIQINKVINYIYLHIPFCIKKCNYCSFFSVKSNAEFINNYIRFLKNEIKLYQKKYSILPKTIYFGGGTPSLLSYGQINDILSQFNLSDVEEITLEANPVSLKPKYIKEIEKTPINRISIGIQSMIDDELKVLGRIHNSKQIEPMIKMLKNVGFNNISLDLIYGLPNQNLSDVIYSLSKIIALKSQHISIYCLSLEKNVLLYKKREFIPEDGIVRAFYDKIVNTLNDNGFMQYEISNFSKKGFESKHNSAYWTDKDYLGLGASAAGYINGIRYNNPPNLEEYFDNVKNCNLMPNSYKISSLEHAQEFLFLGLRQNGGISISEFIKKFDEETFNIFYKKMEHFVKQGFIVKSDDRIFLSQKAFFVSNSIFNELV